MILPVADSVWRVTTPLPFRPRSVHAYLVRLDGGGWMLVDGGLSHEPAWEALDRAVRRVAGGWDGLRLQLLTHMHLDHLGLAERVRTASGAPVAMGRLDAERSAHAASHPEEEAGYRAALLAENGAPRELDSRRPDAANPIAAPPSVDLPLPEKGAELGVAPEWRPIWTPGHTAGHLALFRDRDALLLAGDALLPDTSPTLGVNRQRPDPVGDYLDALDRLQALGPRLALGGHGEPMTRPVERIAELRRATHAEAGRVETLLGAEPRSAWELTRERYAERTLPPSAWMQALRETRAHLDRLVASGRACRTHGPGTVRFSPPPG